LRGAFITGVSILGVELSAFTNTGLVDTFNVFDGFDLFLAQKPALKPFGLPLYILFLYH